MKLSPVDLSKLTKGMFVLVETSDDCVEIGIARDNNLNKKDGLRILILTDSEFQDLPPVFDHTWLPFLPPCKPDVQPDTYPLYEIASSIVEELLAEQKTYLEKEKENAETLYTNAVEHSDEKISDFEKAKNFADSLLQSFCDLESMITELRK